MRRERDAQGGMEIKRAELNVMILAAGIGSRLQPLTATLPKPLVRVGGLSLLAHQLDVLIGAGISCHRILLVGGHGYGQLVKHVPAGVRTVFNPRYKRWNNIYSITLGDLDGGPVLLINGDGFYHPSIFERALTCAEEDFLVVDTCRDLGGEQMKVRLREGVLTEIGKQISAEMADGEYIGVAKFAGPTFRLVREAAADMIHAGETDAWYESEIERVAQERPVRALDTIGLPWIEIDVPDDLRRAEQLMTSGRIPSP